MKKFYESPVVELTGFSAEDVITTSAGVEPIDTTAAGYNGEDFAAAIAEKYNAAGQAFKVIDATGNSTSYTW